MFSTGRLLLGLLLGSVGTGYIVFARKQRRGLCLLCGVGLCVCPYLIGNLVALAVVSVILIALPFYYRI